MADLILTQYFKELFKNGLRKICASSLEHGRQLRLAKQPL
jgi:hypothetical protein